VKVVIFAVLFAVTCFNTVPSATFPDGELPYTRVLGTIPTYESMKVPFLQPAEAMAPVHKDSTEERSTTVFNLGSQPGNLTGGHKWYNPVTDQIIVRSQFTEVPMANYHVALLKQRGEADKIKLDSVLEFRRGDTDSAPIYSFADTHDSSSQHPLPSHEVRGVLPSLDSTDAVPPLPSDSISPDIIPAEESRQEPGGVGSETDETKQSPDERENNDTQPSPNELIVAESGVSHTTTKLVDEDELFQGNSLTTKGDVDMDAVIEMETGKDSGVKTGSDKLSGVDMDTESESGVQEKATSISGTKSRADRQLKTDLAGYWEVTSTKRSPKPKKMFVVASILDKMLGRVTPQAQIFRITQTPREAIKSRGSVALQAIISEVVQLDDLNAFVPEHWQDLSMDEKNNVLPTFTFLEDKYDPTTWEYVKTKARCVGGGHKQDPLRYDDTWSPTVNTSALYIGAGIAAYERRHVMSLDIPGAYLKAELPKEDPPIHVRLNEMEAAILCQLHEEYREYLASDGTMVVKLTRALYGLVQSAQIWYQEITRTLEADGFTRNKYDLCVFNKVVNDEQVSIYLHVDDLLLTSKNEAALHDVFYLLRQKYDKENKMKLKTGKIHSFLGTTFDFSNDGAVNIVQSKFVQEILTFAGPIGGRVATSPAGENLFKERDLELLPSDEQTSMHSLVAMCLYLGKRTRPDILTAVNYLTRRVNKFNKDDKLKLNRLINYLHHSKDLCLTLRFEDGFNIISSVDSAYGVTSECRSTTGGSTSLGGGSIHAQSKVQKLVTKSSTEAETVAASDYAGLTIWVRNFLTSQGYSMEPAVVEQDNMSAMALIKRGQPASARTRHMDIRFFWLTDRVKSGELRIVHVPTELMLADLLTKPLQGEAFTRLRDRILGRASGGVAYVVF
jgi:hypothetical protein